MQHSDFEMPDENIGPPGAGSISKDDLIAHAAHALDCGDHRSAGSFLRDALERFPDDSRLLRLAARQRKQAERFTRVASLLKETRQAIKDDEFVRAAGAFREAANLSHGFADLEEAAFRVAVEEASGLEERNWRVARSLLDDAARLNGKLKAPEHLWESLRAAEHAETIANVLRETALVNPAHLQSARVRVARTLEQYPNDSGLANRLKSLDSTIAAKRQWDERQTRLKKLTDLRAALEHEEDPAKAGNYGPLSEAAAVPHGAEPEFSSVIEDIRQQVVTCEKAAVALAQDRIDDCLEECAWMLSRMRHHRLFLKLKQQAEERELALVDEYSNAVSRIRGFLDAGELAEAAKLCAEARAKLPQFTDFLDLSREIEHRQSEQNRHLQENVASAMRLVERADSSMRQRQFRATEQAFGNALKLLPGDENLIGVVLGILYGYARSMVPDNPDSAAEALNMARRLLPSSAPPADLVNLLGRKREQAKAEAIRKSTPTQVAKRHGRRSTAFLKAISIAAAFIVVVGLGYRMIRRKPAALPAQPLRVEALAETIPVPAATPATGTDVQLTPKPARIKVRGAPPDMRLKLDGVLLAVAKRRVWTKKVAPGRHAIELSRDGYLPKKMVRNFAPGELFTLAGKDVRLESSDARTIVSERQAWNGLGRASLPALENFAAKYPDGLLAKAARLKIEELTWQSVDKANPDSLRAFIAKYPASLFATLAKKDYEATLVARAAKAEDLDWSNANPGNKAALQGFLKKHPAGKHAPAAANALAELERKASAAEAQNPEEAAWQKVNQGDESALDNYLRDAPSGRHRGEAEAALAALRPAEDDAVAVLTVISRFASAWNTKDVDSILAIQKTLKKRAVRAQLSQVKELDVRISPASPPHIEGSQAIVICRRRALRVLSNGTRKQMPETTVSYVLEKHDGNWTIEGTR